MKINLTVEVIPRLGREKRLKVTDSEDQTRGAGDPPPLREKRVKATDSEDEAHGEGASPSLREKRVKATDKMKLTVQVIPRL